MGQVRGLLRAYAIDNPGPAYALQRTNTAVIQLLPDALASVVYIVLDPATGDLTYANAGHPPPIITTGAGQAEYLDDTTGIMLGALPPPASPPATGGFRRARGCFATPTGSSKTGGMTSLTGSRPSRKRCSAASSAEQTCATVQAALVRTARHDDICLLTARLTGR